MLSLNNKRILLLYTKFFSYDTAIKQKLEERGATVDLFDGRAEINVFEKAVKKITRFFYFKKLILFHKKVALQMAKKSYDYIFTNCYLPKEAIECYRKVFPSASINLYLDDSVRNLKGVEKTFRFYDRVFTFDDLDAKNYNLFFRPLFFLDIYKQGKKNLHEKQTYNLCFVGTCHSDRLNIIDKIKSNSPSIAHSFFEFCYLQSKFVYYVYKFFKKSFRMKNATFFKYKPLDTDSLVSVMKKSRAILDINHPKQSGLTIRTIESIGLGAKIITTNEKIRTYDFYDENNVLVINRKNPIIHESFFETEYRDLDKSIYNKYSIDGWIDEVFER